VSPLEHVAAYVAAGLLRALVQPDPVDYTVAVDDCLLQRWHHCTLCGSCPDALDQVLARSGSLGLAVFYCLPCRSADTNRNAMRALLERRYGVP
jgi:hypothetical protein